jgi:hypothetical protein
MIGFAHADRARPSREPPPCSIPKRHPTADHISYPHSRQPRYHTRWNQLQHPFAATPKLKRPWPRLGASRGAARRHARRIHADASRAGHIVGGPEQRTSSVSLELRRCQRQRSAFLRTRHGGHVSPLGLLRRSHPSWRKASGPARAGASFRNGSQQPSPPSGRRGGYTHESRPASLRATAAAPSQRGIRTPRGVNRRHRHRHPPGLIAFNEPVRTPSDPSGPFARRPHDH